MLTFQDDGSRFPWESISRRERRVCNAMWQMLSIIKKFWTAKEILKNFGILGLQRFAALTEIFEGAKRTPDDSSLSETEQEDVYHAMEAIEKEFPEENMKQKRDKNEVVWVIKKYAILAGRQQKQAEDTVNIIRDILEPYNTGERGSNAWKYVKLMFYSSADAEQKLKCIVSNPGLITHQLTHHVLDYKIYFSICFISH